VAGIFFWRADPSVIPLVFPSVFFFFITDKNGDGIRITDDHDSDGINPSEIPSVKLLPIVCVFYTEKNNLSVKLYNDTVILVAIMTFCIPRET